MKPKHIYDTCPICGNPKRDISKTCRKCSGTQVGEPEAHPVSQVQHHILTKDWLTEFRGLFWGEGSAMIVPNGSSYGVILALALREDDGELVKDIYLKLGGTLLRRHTKGYHDQFQWRATRLDHVLEICNLLLDNVQLPAKKVGDVVLVRDFCEWRLPKHRSPLTESEREEMKRRCQELRDRRAVE